jgi:hypothetical protein
MTTKTQPRRLTRRTLVRSVIASSTALALTFGAAGLAQAAQSAEPTETVFASNIGLGSPTHPTYQSTLSAEIADDVQFAGSHLVSSFSIGYKSTEPFHATFRFYGVDQTTELLGAQVAQIERDLPAGETVTTVTLSEAEQFTWIAEPNLYPGEFNGAIYTGGWFSLEFTTASGEPSSAQFRLASGGTSYAYMLNVATGTMFGPYDPNGSLPTSMYLEVRDIGSTVVQPGLLKLVASPTTVKIGGSISLGPYLTSNAPQDTTVTLTSSNRKLIPVPSTVVIPQGATNIKVSVQVGKRLKSTQVVTITATANGTTVSTQVTVTP